MFLRTTAVRVAVAGLAAIALASTATAAVADTATKPATPATGSFAPPGGATPLLNGVEQTLSGTQQYVYDQEFIYWSVTAVRSEGGKPSLSLYADEANETLLAKSNQKKKKTEFVVVDSNHATNPASFYPTATSKGGDSTIELDNDAEILSDGGSIDVVMTESDVVKSVDVNLLAGVSYILTVTVEGDGNGALYLMQSDGAVEDTWYQSIGDAFKKADKKGAGGTEKIKVTGGAADDWHGLILINNSGSGTYTITKTVA